MIVVQIAAVLAALVAMWWGVRAAAHWPPPRRGTARRERAHPLPADLRRCEDLISATLSGGSFARRRLRPTLQELTRRRLGARAGILDRDPEAALELLGPELWATVRPDLAGSDERLATPVSRTQIGAMLEHLEAL